MKRQILIGLICMAMGFLLTRSCQEPEEIKAPDLSKYKRIEDSLNGVIFDREVKIAYGLFRVDSIQKTIKANHEKVKSDIKVLHALPDNRLDHWNDSVLRANGLRQNMP